MHHRLHVYMCQASAHQALLQRPQGGSSRGPLHGGHHVDWAAEGIPRRWSALRDQCTCCCGLSNRRFTHTRTALG